MKKTKICPICEKEFFLPEGSTTRKYCLLCSPQYIKTEDGRNQKPTMIGIRQAMKFNAVRIKGGKCEVCGYNKNIAALCFHHTDPSKKETQLSSGNTRSWEKYLYELEKCQLLCLNCHAEIHNTKNDGS